MDDKPTHLRISDFYNLAEKLRTLELNPEECSQDKLLRTIINRLYYSIYHNLVLAYLFKILQDRKEHVHRELYQYLISERKLAIAEYFNRMREIRIDADYFFQRKMDSAVCNKMTWLPEKIIEHLEKDVPF